MELLLAAAALFLVGLVLLAAAGARRRAVGLPPGRIIYTDTSKWQALEKPLYDPISKLTGRPDYLVKKGSRIIPVEVKSGQAPAAPYHSHIFQLAAYCMLVERQYKTRPTHGLIHYGSRTFAVDYTPALEEALLDLLTEMRQTEALENVDRSHLDAARCRGCGYQYACDQTI